MCRNNLQLVLLFESLLIMITSSSHDDIYEFPFYRGHSLTGELHEENTSEDNGN